MGAKASPLWFYLVALALLLAIAGPFGSFYALSFPARLVYWALVVFGAAAAVALVKGRGATAKQGQLFVALRFVALFAPYVWAVSAAIDPAWRSVAGFVQIAGYVAVITAILASVDALRRRRSKLRAAPAAAPLEPQPRLYDRLPGGLTGSIERLTVDDHYVEVFMDDGTSHRVLMRLSDAVGEMDGIAGFYTHRSHWVVARHVKAATREKRREFLTLGTGAKVPVSRTYRQNAERAGFL